MGKQIPLLFGNNGMQPCDVMVHVDTPVPPRSEVLIVGAVEGTSDSFQGMLEPSSSLYNHCDLLVARVVCRVEQGILPIRVINVTDDTHILKRGMKVGKLFFDVVVEGGDVARDNTSTCSVDALIERLNLHERGFGEAETRAVRELLCKNLSVFSLNDTDLGRTTLITHQIETGDAKPIKLPPRRVPLHLQDEVTEHIKDMQVKGIVQPSCSPWGAPVVPVRKKDGTLRFCVDYRRLNDVTRKDAYPLPRIDDALDSLAHAQWFSTLDLASGYWQVEVDPKDKHKTAFITRQGLFEFNVLSFGLCNAPSTFQRLMDLVLADLQWTTCLVYLDDIIVFGRTFGEHLQRLDEVLGKLRHANLKVKPSKCSLFASQVRYLGHVISAEGIRADPAKIDVVRQWPVPKNQTEVRSFVGLASYYRRFIEGFAEIARPLHRLTEKGRKFKWGDECQRAFSQLKTALVTTPVLAYPDPHKTFILDTDASDMGIGAVLSQEMDGLERVVAYASRALTKQERRYATTKKELLSLVGLEGQLARWIEQLSNFQYKIVHRPGNKHVNADALSRVPSFGAKCENVSDSRLEGGVSVCAVREMLSSGEIEDELVGAQKKDATLQIVEQLWLRGEEGRVEAQTKVEMRGFLPVWDQLDFEQGRLVRKPPLNTDAASKIQVVLPKVMVPEVLGMLHNSITGGHLGVQKLQAKVKDRFYWPGWFEDVKKWCRECTECASRKSSGNVRAPLQPSFASRPFERVALDILGPLPVTGEKNKYILVIGDYFSKWTEAVALPNQEAESVAKVLVRETECFDSANEYVEKVAESLSTVVEAVKAHQLKASGRQKQYFDLKVSRQFYTEGELVWVESREGRDCRVSGGIEWRLWLGKGVRCILTLRFWLILCCILTLRFWRTLRCILTLRFWRTLRCILTLRFWRTLRCILTLRCWLTLHCILVVC
ncbi:interleukin-1 receptor accessory protein-like 1-A [Pimephales promelas]|nr:interleukin-1 receptor accessory protein-like 1-A [Pimephales promelas]